MATRSRIGIELKDGSILSAYHHWDGYPQWLGRILNTHYNSRQQAADLIDGGDMSCAWTNERWNKDLNEFGGATSNKEGTEYGPQYYSQRGEDCPPRVDENYYQFTDKDCGEEYHYIFTTDHEWICIDQHQFTSETPELIQIPGYEVV